MPCSATHSPSSKRRSRWSSVRNWSSGTTDRGWPKPAFSLMSTVWPTRSSAIEVTDRPGPGPGVGVGGLPVGVVERASLEVDLLVRKPVPPGLAAARRDVDHLDRLEQPDRSVLVDELVRCQVHQAVELPPHRLLLAPVPAQELGEEPGRLLLRRAVGGVDRDGRRIGQPIDQCLDPLLGVAQGGDRFDVARPGPRHVTADDGRELDPERLQPVAQAEVADDVVPVVGLDPIQVGRFGPFALAELQPLFEGHDARTGVTQVDLAYEAVERLHLLDRVALHRRAQALPDRAQEVDQHALPEHVDRPRPRAFRSDPSAA